MARILELPDWKFKTTMINMLRILIDNVVCVQKHKGNVSRDRETPKKIMLEIKK